MLNDLYMKIKYQFFVGNCFKKISRLIEKEFHHYYKEKEKHSVIEGIVKGFEKLTLINQNNIYNMHYDFDVLNSFLLFSKSYFQFKYPYKKISKEAYYCIKYYRKDGGDKNPPEDIHWSEWKRILDMIEVAFYNIMVGNDKSEFRQFEIMSGLKEFTNHYFHFYVEH